MGLVKRVRSGWVDRVSSTFLDLCNILARFNVGAKSWFWWQNGRVKSVESSSSDREFC